MAISQSLLTNSEVWVEMNDEAVKLLEDIHKLFFQVILQVPSSTPSPSYFWQTGMLELRFEVMKRKLNFVNSIKNLDENSLAKKIFDEQVKHSWPGLITECDELCDTLNLPRISSNTISRGDIDNAVRESNKDKLMNEMSNLSKLKDMKMKDEFEMQPYFSNKNVHEARTMFRVSSGMFPCKLNFRSDPAFSRELWLCDSCESQVDSMSHVAICPAYQPLRVGKDIGNDKDLAEYMAAA